MSRKYELEIMYKPRTKVLGFKQVDVDFVGTSFCKMTQDYNYHLFYGRTKEVCLNRATNYYFKEIEQKEKELNKLKSTYDKLIEMLYKELEKSDSNE
mgnify:CR=1 FL=1